MLILRVCVFVTVLVGSVLLQDEAQGDSQMPVVINMDGADQRIAERQVQRQLVDEQVNNFAIPVAVMAVLSIRSVGFLYSELSRYSEVVWVICL